MRMRWGKGIKKFIIDGNTCCFAGRRWTVDGDPRGC